MYTFYTRFDKCYTLFSHNYLFINTVYNIISIHYKCIGTIKYCFRIVDIGIDVMYVRENSILIIPICTRVTYLGDCVVDLNVHNIIRKKFSIFFRLARYSPIGI